jgi:hypothetical protein
MFTLSKVRDRASNRAMSVLETLSHAVFALYTRGDAGGSATCDARRPYLLKL